MNSKGLGVLLALMAMTWLGIWFGLPRAILAQSQNGITQPVTGDELSGVVVIEGTATHPGFLRYELAFFQEARPDNEWIVFAQGDQQVIGETLAVWDTTVGSGTNPVFPDGRYQLRLRVVRSDYNYDEYYVRDLVIANETVTPSPTPGITTTLTAGAPTPLPATILAATVQASSGVLPSLTPFPTPSPQATPEDAVLGPAEQDVTSPPRRQGLLVQLSSIDTGQFLRAFLLGARVVAFAFAALATYMLLRAAFRWLRRRQRTGRQR